MKPAPLGLIATALLGAFFIGLALSGAVIFLARYL